MVIVKDKQKVLNDADVLVVKTKPAHSEQHEHHLNSTEIQLKHAFAGGLSGAMTRALCQPFDVLKIRFQLQVEPLSDHQTSKYKSMSQACRLVIKEEGMRGLWKGHNPAQVLSIIFGISQFWSYEELVTLSKDYKLLANNTAVTNFVCGGISGAIATFAASPLDVVRTRLIAQDFSNGYSSSIEVRFK